MITICNPPTKTKPIPTCIGELIIGTISLLSTNILIFIEDITIGEKYRFQETSNGAGLVSIDFSEQDLSDRHAYELYITKVTDQIKVPITIGSETATDIALKFSHCVENGEIVELPQTVLEVE